MDIGFFIFHVLHTRSSEIEMSSPIGAGKATRIVSTGTYLMEREQ